MLKTQERNEQEGDLVNYSDSTAIHQVQNIKAQTVSINIILEYASRDCRELYLLNNAKYREPERFSLSQDEREKLVNTVLDKLINHVNSSKYKI